jgi:hypothetical protein
MHTHQIIIEPKKKYMNRRSFLTPPAIRLRRKTMFGGTPNPTRGTRMLPRRFGAGIVLGDFS